MIKLKKLIKESVWDRKFGEPLPTLQDTTRRHKLTEKKELGGAALESIRMLTDRNSHTRARAELARHVGDKRLIQAYEGMMYIENLLKGANETVEARSKLDKMLFARAAKVFSNFDIIKSVF